MIIQKKEKKLLNIMKMILLKINHLKINPLLMIKQVVIMNKLNLNKIKVKLKGNKTQKKIFAKKTNQNRKI